jgi:hypothetical protein
MKLKEVIILILERTNIRTNYSQVAKILGISRQSVSRYKEVDLSERYIRAIESHFKFSLAPKLPNTQGLQKTDNIMHLKVPKGIKEVLLEIE